MSELIDTYSIAESTPNFKNGRCLPKHGYFIRQTNKLYNQNNGLIFFNEEHDEYIFKLIHPIGSLLILYQPLYVLEYAQNIQRRYPDQIDYSYYGCIFRYFSSNLFAYNNPVFITSGNTLHSTNGLYYEDYSEGGSTQSQFTTHGTTDGHVLIENEMPYHNHSITYQQCGNEAPNYGCKYGGDGFVNRVVVNGGKILTSYTGGINGTTQPHNHDFTAQGTVQINPTHKGIFIYVRIQ